MTVSGVDIQYSWHEGCDISNDILLKCAQLFSNHYGVWSTHGVKPGAKIKLSPEKLKDYIPEDKSWIVLAHVDEEIVGYAFAARVRVLRRTVTWVTQLVVHQSYQNRGIAKTMLNSIWGFSDHYAWGIASANPYAIRALEKATKRRCRPVSIMTHQANVLEYVGKSIPYLSNRNIKCSPLESVINTEFFQDHSEVHEKIKRVSNNGIPWILGSIQEGEEWLAMTFNRQKQIRWSEQEFDSFIKAASSIARDAYDRMAVAIPKKNHTWAKYAKSEIDFLCSQISDVSGKNVLDFGCGTGRHSLELAQRGYNVTGVDFSVRAIDFAKSQAEKLEVSVNFYRSDCRNFSIEGFFDIGICLYDVIGSFPDHDDNIRILDNLSRHIRPGGCAIISVMSLEYTRKIAKYKYDIIADSTPLLKLSVSETMQNTGNVFDPEYFILDEKRGVVYRKERFDFGEDLPAELIVRDRRYEVEEISEMCRKVGLRPFKVGHVSAGHFEKILDVENPPAKEILIIAKKDVLL